MGLHPDNNRGKYYAKTIGFVLSEDYWGNGYVPEAVKRAVKYAFEELNIDILTAFHYPHNNRSKRVIEKCGFKYETTIEKGSTIYDGQVFDSVCHSIFKSDYFNSAEEIRMNIIIKPLTPDLAEDYVHFFDVTPHDDGTVKEQLPCYCITWRSDASYSRDNRHWFPTRKERRERAIEFVKEGSLQGYLAYLGDEIVGWCNATADCQGGVEHYRSYWPIDEYRADIKVKSVFCFVVAPKVQRMGVATKLLERVCEDASADGFDFVEAYVHKKFDTVPHDFRGPLAMYEKCGFIKVSEKDGKAVMRKELK